jgi:decaprenyl-phosphate phosphoribosyltransferase
VSVTESAIARPRTGGLPLARGLLVGMRPRQWPKNALVVLAPAAAGALDAGVVRSVALAFLAFCLVSGGTYLLNDAVDVHADRRHPVKCLRPVAAGAVPRPAAVVTGLCAIVSGLVAAALGGWLLLAVVGAYVALTAAYNAGLKHEPVADIALVASGFFVRALAGGVAADVPISRWFIIVTAFASLYIVTGKRYAEIVRFGEDAPSVRPSLAAYTPDYLRQVLTMTAGVAVLAYCLWAFEGRLGASASTWSELSIAPFVLGVLRYGLRVDRGEAGEPEEILFSDRPLQLMALAWAALLAADILL